MQLVVGAALVDRLPAPSPPPGPSRLLGARRTRPAALAGQWELPGGKVEPGERPEDALRREVAEELGVSILLGYELRSLDGAPWPLTQTLVMRVWWCTVASGTPSCSDAHDELRWLHRSELGGVDWLSGDRSPVALVARSLLDG